MTRNTQYDVFISHASEDKDDVARPLAIALRDQGVVVWLDEFGLTVGDALSRKVDEGLATCHFGVVILSPAYFRKQWPRRELDGLFAREEGATKVVLPVWHKVGVKEVAAQSPIIAARLAVSTDRGIEHVAGEIHRAIRQSAMPQRVPAVSSAPSSSLQPTAQREQMLSLQKRTRAIHRELLEESPGGVLAGLLGTDCLELAGRVTAHMTWVREEIDKIIGEDFRLSLKITEMTRTFHEEAVSIVMPSGGKMLKWLVWGEFFPAAKTRFSKVLSLACDHLEMLDKALDVT